MPDVEQLSAMKISEVLDQWPATADVFHKHDMACVGCVVAPFYTIADAASIYSLSLTDFVGELTVAIRGPESQTDGQAAK